MIGGLQHVEAGGCEGEGVRGGRCWVRVGKGWFKGVWDTGSVASWRWLEQIVLYGKLILGRCESIKLV